MANLEKNRLKYQNIVHLLDTFSSGNYVENLESIVSKLHTLFLGGYVPTEFPSSDFGRRVLEKINDYSQLVFKRKKIVITGGERETATEEEAYDSLRLSEWLATNLIIPLFRKKTDFSNKIIKDIHNLSLSYVHAIVSGVGDEYISVEDAPESKILSTQLAKQGLRICNHYEKRGLKEINLPMNNFRTVLEHTSRKFMRSFELVPTTQKRIYKGKELMDFLAEKITSQDSSNKFFFKPSVIFPIAQGGNELGIRISNSYEDKGYSLVVYPLLYSIKTRKHRYPWIQNDALFLGESLEGKDILVTEDWVTTGNTLRGILNKLENVYPHEIKIATIKRDKEKSQIPLLDKYNFYIGSWSLYEGNKTDTLSGLDE